MQTIHFISNREVINRTSRNIIEKCQLDELSENPPNLLGLFGNTLYLLDISEKLDDSKASLKKNKPAHSLSQILSLPTFLVAEAKESSIYHKDDGKKWLSAFRPPTFFPKFSSGLIAKISLEHLFAYLLERGELKKSDPMFYCFDKNMPAFMMENILNFHQDFFNKKPSHRLISSKLSHDWTSAWNERDKSLQVLTNNHKKVGLKKTPTKTTNKLEGLDASKKNDAKIIEIFEECLSISYSQREMIIAGYQCIEMAMIISYHNLKLDYHTDTIKATIIEYLIGQQYRFSTLFFDPSSLQVNISVYTKDDEGSYSIQSDRTIKEHSLIRYTIRMEVADIPIEKERLVYFGYERDSTLEKYYLQNLAKFVSIKKDLQDAMVDKKRLSSFFKDLSQVGSAKSILYPKMSLHSSMFSLPICSSSRVPYYEKLSYDEEKHKSKNSNADKPISQLSYRRTSTLALFKKLKNVDLVKVKISFPLTAHPPISQKTKVVKAIGKNKENSKFEVLDKEKLPDMFDIFIYSIIDFSPSKKIIGKKKPIGHVLGEDKYQLLRFF